VKQLQSLRKYHQATIFFKAGGSEDVFEVELFQSVIIYMDKKGNEYTTTWFYVKQVVQYNEEKQTVMAVANSQILATVENNKKLWE